MTRAALNAHAQHRWKRPLDYLTEKQNAFQILQLFFFFFFRLCNCELQLRVQSRGAIKQEAKPTQWHSQAF